MPVPVRVATRLPRIIPLFVACASQLFSTLAADHQIENPVRQDVAAPAQSSAIGSQGSEKLRQHEALNEAQADPVDVKVQASLEQAPSKPSLDQMKAEALELRAKARAVLVQLQAHQSRADSKAQKAAQRYEWFLEGLILFCLVFLAIFCRRAHRKIPKVLLPTRVARGSSNGTVICCPACSETMIVQIPALGAPSTTLTAANSLWKRSVAPHPRAGDANAVLRAALIPHLARWMMTKLFQQLLSQRMELRNTQQLAELEVVELEKRLATIQAPLQERLSAYEKRIASLEQQLAAKTQENLELISAQIALTRKKLESERLKEPVGWN